MNNAEKVKKEITQHRKDVQRFMSIFCSVLDRRADEHDMSKYSSPEIEAITLIKNTKFGTDEYNRVCNSEGILEHYKNNSHHPEHYEDGMNGMDLFDLVEYFIDVVMAASRRSGQLPDFKKLKERHNISYQLYNIFCNTLDTFRDKEVQYLID